VRSDRSQNSRTEALNLIRNRKGSLPHVAAVTAEPLPTRLASLALGTGDLDCVYHFALDELQDAILTIENEDQMDMLRTLVDGRRLRAGVLARFFAHLEGKGRWRRRAIARRWWRTTWTGTLPRSSARWPGIGGG